MVFSDNTVPHALCLTYVIEQWNVLADEVVHYWEFGICGLQNTPDLSEINWDYVGDWTTDFALVSQVNGDHIFISELSTYNDSIAKFQAEERVRSLEWSPQDTYLLSTSSADEAEETYVELWTLESETRLWLLTVDEPLVSITWSPDEQSLTVVTGEEYDYTLKVFDVSSGEERFELTFVSPPVLRWRPDSSEIAIRRGSTEDERIDLVDSNSGEATSLFDDADGITIRGLDWHPSGEWLAVSIDNELIIYDVDNRIASMSVPSDTGIIKWSPDGTLLATHNPDRTIGIWSYDLGG